MDRATLFGLNRNPVIWLFMALLLGLSLLSGRASALNSCSAVQLEVRSDFHADLGPAACAYSDASRQLTLLDVTSPNNAARLEPVKGGLVDFGFSADRFWVVVHLRNASSQTGIWWVTHDIPVAESLNVHLVSKTNTALNLLSLTDGASFFDRPIAHRHLVSEIALQPGEEVALVIDYTSAQATEMPLFVEAVPSFFKRTQNENVEIVALTALVIGMGLISAVYLFGLAGNAAIPYSGYVLSGTALLVHMDGYGFQYIWPNMPTLNQFALPVIATTFVALGLHFVSSFTNARSYHPYLQVIALGLISTLFFFAIATPWFVSAIWFKYFLLGMVLLGTLMQVVLAATAMYRGQSGSWLLVLGFGALAASLTLGVVGYLTEGLFPQEIAGRAIRFGFLIEATAFSGAIALRIRATRLQRDASLKEQLRLSQDRLHLSEALRRAEIDRQTAKTQAKRSQEALQSTAHDMRQPLAALQMALSDGLNEPNRFASSLEYMESIVRGGLESTAKVFDPGDREPPLGSVAEVIPANLILQNVEVMFAGEADRKSVDLVTVGCSATLNADPLALMRIIGNLVSNALQHAEATRIVLGCRRRSGSLCFEVHDNGKGIQMGVLARLSQRGLKGNTSDGHGLGLSIVTELADEHGMVLDMTSTPGRGTVASICVGCIEAQMSKTLANVI